MHTYLDDYVDTPRIFLLYRLCGGPSVVHLSLIEGEYKMSLTQLEQGYEKFIGF